MLLNIGIPNIEFPFYWATFDSFSKKLLESVKKHCVAFLKAARYIDPDYQDELEALIDELDLEFWGVENIKESLIEKPP